MRTYLGIFRMRMIAGFQYRAAAWAGVATQFFFGAVFILIYKAFYDSATVPPEMQFNQLVDYIWGRQAFLMIMVVVIDMDLLRSIASGDIAYELTRPINLYWLWSGHMTAQRLSSAMMRCLPILAVAYFLPAPFNFGLPPSAASVGLFVAALLLALCVMVAVSMFVYVLTFVTMSPLGSRLMLLMVSDFLSGGVIPIPLMPDGMQKALSCLPFRYVADFPLRVYSGNIAGAEALMGIAVQIGWVVLLVLLGQSALRGALNRTVIQGG